MRVGQDKRQGSHWGSDKEMAEMKMACTKAVAMQVGTEQRLGEKLLCFFSTPELLSSGRLRQGLGHWRVGKTFSLSILCILLPRDSPWKEF